MYPCGRDKLPQNIVKGSLKVKARKQYNSAASAWYPFRRYARGVVARRRRRRATSMVGFLRKSQARDNAKNKVSIHKSVSQHNGELTSQRWAKGSTKIRQSSI